MRFNFMQILKRKIKTPQQNLSKEKLAALTNLS